MGNGRYAEPEDSEPKFANGGIVHTADSVWLDAGTGAIYERYTTKDSGKRQDYASGMRRDTQEGKPRYDLVDLEMLTRWAGLMERGAAKYSEDNWRLANSKEELLRFRASAFRHFIQWFSGQTDEDHGAAVFFNIAAAEFVKKKLNPEGQ